MEVEEDNARKMTEESQLKIENIEPVTSCSKSATNKIVDVDITDISNVSENAESTCNGNNDSERVTKGENLEVTNNDKTVEEASKTNDAANVTIDLSKLFEAATSQNNSPTSSNENEFNALPSDQMTSKRSISKNQVNGDSGISMEKSGNSSDEDSSKRQKLNDDSKKAENGNSGNTSRFHKLKSKVKKRNYRNKKRPAGDSAQGSNRATDESSSQAERATDIPNSPNNYLCGMDANENASSHGREDQLETFTDSSDDDVDLDDSNEWTTVSEDELDEEEQETPVCLKKQKPKSNWLTTTELIKRELGINPLFRRKYYGSLHVVERLELMYKLNEHEGCVNALNFNQKGNLLASGSDDLAVVIWDWAIGKKHHSYDSGHRSNLFQVRWLPFDVEYLMATCGRDGQVRLLDLQHGTTRKLASHHGSIHKLAIHPDSPHVIISCGEDAKVLSIDIREGKPTKLLLVKDVSEVQLYTIHSNPRNSNEFCVGGRSQIVRIYDQRELSTPVHELCPQHLVNNSYAHVTCAVYNYDGTEVLVSYNDEDIYLFDTSNSGPFITDVAHRYQGHRNSATVKGVNYFGPKSEYIVSGSDCGNIFIWDKNTEAIVQWMPGDEQGVVNNLEPHPHIPILATSGLDYDVKIWVPSCEQPPLMKDLESCVKLNAINRTRTANVPQAFDEQMLWVLLRHMHHTERARDRNTSRGEYNLDENVDDTSNEFDSSDHSDSDSEDDSAPRLRCRPS